MILRHAKAPAVGTQTQAVVQRISALSNVSQPLQRQHDDVRSFWGYSVSDSEFRVVEAPTGIVEHLGNCKRTLYRIGIRDL